MKRKLKIQRFGPLYPYSYTANSQGSLHGRCIYDAVGVNYQVLLGTGISAGNI